MTERSEIDPLDAALDELFGAPGSGEQNVAPVDVTHPDSRVFVWDLESGPQTKSRTARYYTPLPAPREFDPASVKVGNLGKEKAQEKIEAKRQEHEEVLARFESDEINHWETFQDQCALNPATGRVLTSQYLFVDKDDAIYVHEAGWKQDDANERAVLEAFWERVDHVRRSSGRIIGYNISDWDFPFACQRSAYHGLTLPKGLMWRNRYLADFWIDLYAIWKRGRHQKFTEACGLKLKEVCTFLGLKNKSMDGGTFWKKYKNAKTRAEALEYAAGDVVIEAQLARRLGVIE